MKQGTGQQVSPKAPQVVCHDGRNYSGVSPAFKGLLFHGAARHVAYPEAAPPPGPRR